MENKKMNTQNNCPVCSSTETAALKLIPMYPAIIFPVDENVDVDQKDIEIYTCKVCSHIFQTNVDDDFNALLYKKYYKYYPYSNAEFFLKHYRIPFEHIFKTFVSDRKSGDLLEIGVSDQKQLDFFDSFAFDSIGITPENIEHPRIISSFYEDYEFGRTFNVIVSRFNLEHIVNLDVFMSKVGRDLNDEGIFIAQVPNTETYLQDNILNFYAHEHIHYFNKQSLTALFEKYGFSIEAAYSYKSPSLLVVGIKGKEEKQIALKNYTYKSSNIKRKIKTVIESCATDNRKVIFYGAGLSLSGLLYDDNTSLLQENCNVVIFDDNPVVAGKYMPAFNVSIKPYDYNDISKGDIIILTLNAIYHDKVIKKIRADGLANDVYCIDQYGFKKTKA